MTTVEFANDLPLLPHPAARPSTFAATRRPRLAIVSTRDELCGIAAYTRYLERRLRDDFDITLFDLDQYLLRHRHRRVRRLADRHILEICRSLPRHDSVNLQLEHGTLGSNPGDIERRLRWLVHAAPRLSVTFHTVFTPAPVDLGGILSALGRLNLGGAARLLSQHRRRMRLAGGPVRTLRRAQRTKRVVVIVHNRRDHRQLRHVAGLNEVWDHPLAFLDAAEAGEIRRQAARSRFPLLERLPTDAKLIGLFGFYGRYKGFETAVRAMHLLPPDYHLVLFGGIHPNAIQPYQPIDPVISSVFAAGYVDMSLAERLAAQARDGNRGLTLAVDGATRELLTGDPRDLTPRLHFLGPLGDADFLAGMTLCDAVVFPYLEVGQSASGPLSQALELGCRIIAARTHAFLQFAQYHPDMIEFFDIGNHLELAARIRARPQFDPRQRRLDYSVATNKALYIAANSGDAVVPAA